MITDAINEVGMVLADAELELGAIMEKSGLDEDSEIRLRTNRVRYILDGLIEELDDIIEGYNSASKTENETARKIEFVSYDGKWPNLCSGKLALKVDGTEQTFEYCLCSGGFACCGFNGECDVVTQGDWTLKEDKFSGFSDEELKVIAKLVNDNVPHGCCGGCL